MSEARTCPECSAEADKQGRRFDGPSGSMWLGLHRKRDHGVAGKGDHKPKPRKDRAPKDASAHKPASIKSDLRKLFKLVGTLVAVVDPYCGNVLVAHSAKFSDALADLATQDPRIAKWLRGLSKAGPYGALIMAAGELAIPIAAHHGAVPPELTLLIGVDLPPPKGRSARIDLVSAAPSPPSPEDPGDIIDGSVPRRPATDLEGRLAGVLGDV